MNRVFSLFLLIFFAPIFLIIIVCIWIEDGLPIFFKQQRFGKNGKLFWIYKFRSMKNDTPNVASHLLENPNQYLLKIGGFIRKTSIDELPNLLNILKGEMNFIGPRPALYNQTELQFQRKKKGIETLKPGITGWAQINGRDEISDEDKIKLDLEYLNTQSFLIDFKILILTFLKVIKKDGINH